MVISRQQCRRKEVVFAEDMLRDFSSDSTRAGASRLKGRSIYAPCPESKLAPARVRCTKPLGLEAPVRLPDRVPNADAEISAQWYVKCGAILWIRCFVDEGGYVE